MSIFRSLEHNPSLEELDLSGNRQLAVGDSEAVGCAVERMLKVNRTLKVLNLTDCGLTNELVSYFTNRLAQNHSVRKVILHSNNIGNTGAMSIFRSLEHNTSLEELDLSGNSQLAGGESEAVGCAIERMLNVNRTLSTLNLSGCNITDPIVKHILTGLMKNTSLVTLNIGSPIVSGSCAVSLFLQMATHPTLSITVDDLEVNVLGVGWVKMDRGTVWCVMRDTVPENCVEFFRALNHSSLKVSKLNIQDLTDQTAESFALGLAESQTIRAMTLSHNFWEIQTISSAGAVSKFRSLECNTSLEELDLSGNRQLAVGDSEAVGCAVERMLKVNRTLKVLNLTDCGLTNELVSYFANRLAQNHSVRKVILHSNNIGSTGAMSIFRSLEHNTSLEELDLSGNSQLAGGESEAVGCAIERMLNVNRTLKILNLSGCNITDPIAKHILTGLTKNTSLVTLEMRSPKLSGSCAVSLFQHMTTHCTLNIAVGEVNVLGVGKVKIDRGSLWCVIGDLIPENCVEFFKALNNSGLKVSKLNVQDLTDQTAEHFSIGLAESQSIQTLKLKLNSISSIGVGSIFRSLQHNTSLEELDLSGNSQLAEDDIEAANHAYNMLTVNMTLKVLNLSGCSLGIAVVVSVFRSLEHNTSLEELDLSENRQLAEGDSEAVGCAIERMLNVNRTLKVLNLSGCRLDTAVANHIAAGLVQNDYLIKLNIERNGYITSEGWVDVFKALCNNTSLKKLDINVNNVWMEGSVALAEMLSLNKSLTELSLRDCLIPEAGLREIARGLLQNTSLKKLDIGFNKLGMEGSVALAEMLSCNKSLTELNLGLCDIPEDGLTEIARGLLQNNSLRTLTLWSLLDKTFLEAEFERLKKSGNFTPQSSSRLKIKY